MARAVAVMIAFRAQHEAVEAARLAHSTETSAAAGEQFVNIGLVAHIENKPVSRSIEDVMHSQRQFDDAEVRTQVAAGL